MQRLRHILVGVEFDRSSGKLTEGSRAAANRALWLANRTEARVEFLHSVHHNPEDGAPRERDEGGPDRTELEALIEEHGGGPLDLSVSEEPPWIALARHVADGSSDLVVVGKRNQSRRKSRRLGSVSLRLIQTCPSPVWVIKPEHTERHASVIAATDLTPVGDRATEYGAFLAGVEECDLHVVHAWQLSLELQMSASRIGSEEFERRKRQIATDARDHILALPAVAALGERVTTIIRREAPSRAIRDAVEQVNPDLVVLGTISRGGVSGLLVGNTAERLLHRLDCSLLTVKPEDFVSPIGG